MDATSYESNVLEFDNREISKTASIEIPLHDSNLYRMGVLIRQSRSLKVVYSSWIDQAKTNAIRIATDLPFLAKKPLDQGVNLDEDEMPRQIQG